MRRVFALLGIVVVTLLLAFPLRGAVYQAVIIPIAYVLWILELVYHAVHQSLWWIVVVALMMFVILRSLLPKPNPRGKIAIKTKPALGQVEALAGWIKKSERGSYFKWLIANRLGRIAFHVVSQRETGATRSVFDPLTGLDWNPNEDLQSYFESGLRGSFADYPHENKLFSRPKKIPLDNDVNDAIEFLEAEIGNN